MAVLAAGMIEPLPEGAFLHLAEFTASHVLQPGYDHRREFEYSLDALEQRVLRSGRVPDTAAT